MALKSRRGGAGKAAETSGAVVALGVAGCFVVVLLAAALGAKLLSGGSRPPAGGTGKSNEPETPVVKPAPAAPPRAASSFPTPPPPPSPDPLFDFQAIVNDPLDARVLKTTEADGLVTEEFEYTSFVVDGKADRVRGVLVRPREGTQCPGVFWSQSGMYEASTHFPALFARKGCVSLNITLPHARRNSFAAFDTSDPYRANLTLLAIDQMRAITYLTQRPEVDGKRIAVVGSSYGGFFAALLAGADPRVSGGASFFGAGRQTLGTNLPQFTNLKTPSDVETWNRLIDPAARLSQRDVPFLFTCPSNDNWFFPPSVVRSFRDAAGDCRLAIVPRWQHGFPPNVDQQIVDFMDVVLAMGRKPYNKPGELVIEKREGKAVGRWAWAGENKVKRAELIVSYGPVKPWQYWLYRHYESLTAKVDGSSASAAIPLPFAGVKAYVFGNITDENDVVTSTVPVEFDSASLGEVALAPELRLNGAPFGDFEAEGVGYLKAVGEQSGVEDKVVKHGGEQSVRIDAPPGDKPIAPSIQFKLCWTPGVAHRLSVWLRSAKATKLDVRVEPAPPAQWRSATVLELVRRERPEAAVPTAEQLAAHTRTIDADEPWTRVEIDVPAPTADVDGYNLRLIGSATDKTPFWVDDLEFTPVWPTK